MPYSVAVLAVVDVAVIVIDEEPSRLPIVLPRIFAGASTADVDAWMPMNAELEDVVLARDEVCAMPEIVLPWIVLVVPAAVDEPVMAMPRNSFDEPLSVVVPVPSAAPKPIVLPVTTKLPPSADAATELIAMPE